MTFSDFLAATPPTDGLVYVVRSLLGGVPYEQAPLLTLRKIHDQLLRLFQKMDKLTVGYYVNLLGREFKPKATWAQLAKEAAGATKTQEQEGESTVVIGGKELEVPNWKEDPALRASLQEFGIARAEGVMWREGATRLELLSNFTARGLFFVATDGVTHRLIEIKNIAGARQYIEIQGTDKCFKTEADARLFFGRFGNYEFFGEKKDTIGLWRCLLSECVHCVGISQLGWQDAGFWVWANGVYVPGEGFQEFSEYGTVTIHGTHYYCAAANRINAHALGNRNRLKFVARFSNYSFDDWQTQFLRVYGNNGKIGLLFLLVSLFRDIVQDNAGMVPILNAFGKCGTGKSVMLRSLTRMFFKNPVLTNLANSTLPSLDNAVHEYRNVPIAFDEYSVNITREKVEFIKSLFDGGGRVKTIASDVDGVRYNSQSEIAASVCIAGQQIPDADSALLTRILSLEFKKSQYTDEEQDNLETLLGMEQEGLSGIIHTFLNHRKLVEDNFSEVYMHTRRQVRKHINELGLKSEERIISTWSILITMYRILSDVLGFAFTIKDILAIAVEQIGTQITDLQDSNELSTFWSTFANLVQRGDILQDADYKVVRATGDMTNDHGDPLPIDEGTELLYLNMTTVYPQYLRSLRDQGGHLFTRTTIQKYLKSAEGFVKSKRSCRWDMPNRSGVKMDKSRSSVIGKAWVFKLSDIDLPIAFNWNTFPEEIPPAQPEELRSKPTGKVRLHLPEAPISEDAVPNTSSTPPLPATPVTEEQQSTDEPTPVEPATVEPATDEHTPVEPAPLPMEEYEEAYDPDSVEIPF